MSNLQYYDEVEKKLALLTNKTHKAYDKTLARGMCEKFRGDALHVFISGHPPHLSSALSLAQQVEANQERYATFARGQEERGRAEPRAQGRQHKQSAQGN